MSFADRISLLRILLAPAIVACLVYYHPTRDSLRYLALGLFVLGMLSDAVDGFIARATKSQSHAGAVLDPIADKLLILSTLISLSAIRGLPEFLRIPAWFNLVVISRDAVLIAGTMVIFGLTGTLSVKPSRLGKWTSAAQMLVIPAILLGWPFKLEVLAAVAVLTILSGVGYVRMGIALLGEPSK